jgi:uncharacterized protein YbjT (DUF2867 family)
MDVVLGATGNTGSVIAKALLEGGQKVRVVGRSKERLAGFVIRGAEALEADLMDSGALTKAFTGARAVYAILPPDHASTDYRAQQDRETNSIAAALEAAGVTHVVALSSFGADKPDISNNVGPVKLFLKTLLSFHLKEFFSFAFFLFPSSLHRRPRLVCNLAVGFSPT